MEKLEYRTHGTCSRQVNVEVDGDVITSCAFVGGCSGNTQGVAALVVGMKVDDAIKKLINYFSEQDEDTIIVFFGDHQPTNSVISPIWKLNGKSSSTLSLEDEILRYKVPFFIWANYDITEESNVETSPNYLGNKVLEAAGIPLSDFRSFLAELEESYPVISSIRVEDASGNSYETKEVEDALNEYAILQYHYLLDHK